VNSVDCSYSTNLCPGIIAAYVKASTSIEVSEILAVNFKATVSDENGSQLQ